MGLANRAIVAACLGVTAALLVSCGSSNGLLDAAQASRLNTQLDRISAYVSAGRCAAAQQAVDNLQVTLASYSSVDQRLIENLNQGVETIAQLANGQCRSLATVTTARTTPVKTTTTATITPTTPTITVATTTVPTTPVLTTTTPETGTQTTGGVGFGGTTTTATTTTTTTVTGSGGAGPGG